MLHTYIRYIVLLCVVCCVSICCTYGMLSNYITDECTHADSLDDPMLDKNIGNDQQPCNGDDVIKGMNLILTSATSHKQSQATLATWPVSWLFKSSPSSSLRADK